MMAVASVYPVRRLTAFAALKARSEKSRRSTSGELVRSSSQAKAASATAPIAAPPSTSGSVQPLAPETVMAPMPATSASDSRAAPARSSPARARGVSIPPATT